MGRVAAIGNMLLLQGVLVWPTCAFSEESEAQDVIVPDEAVQLQIDRVVQAHLTCDYEWSDSTRQMFDEQAALLALVNEDMVALYRQLLYYRLHPRSKHGSLMVSLVSEYARIGESTIVRSLLPYVASSDAALRKEVRETLSAIERGVPQIHPPNYEVYSRHLRGRMDDSPLPLIEYMYRKAPGEALHTCDRAFRNQYRDEHDLSAEECISNDKAIRWGSHVVADILWQQENGFLRSDDTTPEALEQLATLSTFDQWWVRLYVAEILRSEPEFQTDSVVAALKQDAHPLVRKTIEEAKEERAKFDKKRAPRLPLPRVTLPTPP